MIPLPNWFYHIQAIQEQIDRERKRIARKKLQVEGAEGDKALGG